MSRRRIVWLAGAGAVLLVTVTAVLLVLSLLETAEGAQEAEAGAQPTSTRADSTQVPRSTPEPEHSPAPDAPGERPDAPPEPAPPPPSQTPSPQPPPPTAARYSVIATQTGAAVPVGVLFRFSHEATPCGTNTCISSVESGTRVTVTALIGDPSYVVVLWEGCDDDRGNVCTVTVTSDTTVKATVAKGWRLQLAIEGGGSVGISPIALDCTLSPCTQWYPNNTVVTMTATARAGHEFARWANGWDAVCGAAPRCQFQIQGDVSVSVIFRAIGAQQ